MYSICALVDAIVSNSGTEFYVMFMANIVEKMVENEQMNLIISNPSTSTNANVNVSRQLSKLFCLNIILCKS